MSRRTKRILVVAAVVFAVLALLNPRYSSVSVEGPNGPIRTQQLKLDPGGLFVYTRVVADETSVEIEQR